MLLPAQPGPHPHLVVIAGKGGTIYLIDRDHMGHYQPNNDSHAVQTIPSPGGGVCGSMAYWNHNLYVLSNSAHDALRQFTVQNGRLSLKAASGSRFPAACATPTISANGLRDGVLWVLHSRAWGADDTNAVLFAYDALDTSRLLYVSEQNPSRDRAGLALRFNIPTIANGQCLCGSQGAKWMSTACCLTRRHANEPAVSTVAAFDKGYCALGSSTQRVTDGWAVIRSEQVNE